MDGASELVHATAIAVGADAALIRGASGAGKSDLALRCLAYSASSLITEAPRLVSDDQVILTRAGATIEARAPETIRGKLEVRGVGIVTLPSVFKARVRLVVELTAPGGYPRLPDPEATTHILGLSLPIVWLAPFEVSAPEKLLLALVAAARPQPAD